VFKPDVIALHTNFQHFNNVLVIGIPGIVSKKVIYLVYKLLLNVLLNRRASK
jgi:hypothetical protein